MGQKIVSGNFAASAELRKTGAMLKGVFQGGRTITTKWGSKNVYSVKVIDAECDFTKNKAPYEPAKNEVVEFLATTTLDGQMKQVKVNQIVTIKYLGLGTATKGNAPHLFDVEVE